MLAGAAHIFSARPPHAAPLAASSTALASQREFSASPPTVGVVSVWWSALTVVRWSPVRVRLLFDEVGAGLVCLVHVCAGWVGERAVVLTAYSWCFVSVLRVI